MPRTGARNFTRPAARAAQQRADNDPATTLAQQPGALSTTCVDPVITPSTFSAAAKVFAQQSFQAGKARMRVKPSHGDRKAAYMRFQDAAVATMSVMLMIASSYESGMKLPEPLMLRLEAETGEFGKALRGLYMVAPQEVVTAAEKVAAGLLLLRPNMGKDGVAEG